MCVCFCINAVMFLDMQYSIKPFFILFILGCNIFLLSFFYIFRFQYRVLNIFAAAPIAFYITVYNYYVFLGAKHANNSIKILTTIVFCASQETAIYLKTENFAETI